MLWWYIPCANEGRQGICVFSYKCKGETINGLCPGGNDFKCCLENNAKEDITLLASNENLFFGLYVVEGGLALIVKLFLVKHILF